MRVSPWKCTAALSRAACSYSAASSLAASSIRQRAGAQIPSISLARCATHVRLFSHTRARLEEQKAQESGDITQFAQLSEKNMVHENIVKSITDMGLKDMTEIQTATIKSALQGTDVVAQAKTGTGKTLAFLLPVLQRMIEADPNLAKPAYRLPRTSADDIRGIIISPTRELAEQIAVEATKVCKGTSIVVQAAVGGTQKSQMLRKMQRQGCHLLVGTPGRLSDIFSDEYSGVAAPKLKALVMDEADRLLDQGFWADIQAFMKLIPDRSQVDRQTLMFSATIPKEVVHIVRQTLKPGFQFVRTMGGEADAPTTARVKQNITILRGYENQIPALIELAQREMAAHKADPENKLPFKAIVYFRSTAEVALARSIMSNLSSDRSTERDAFGMVVRSNRSHPLRPMRLFHIHSKLSQASRTNAAEAFREAETAMLLSSDVTARGLDFPNVTHVIQIGGPSDRESYIHRIGRTARAGKEGEGWIFVTEPEAADVDRMLRRIPIDEDTSLKAATADMSHAADAPADSPLAMALTGGKAAPRAEKNLVYSILIGSSRAGNNKRQLVAACNALAANGWGMDSPPPFAIQRAQKLGLGRIAGLNLVDQAEIEDEPRRDGGRSFGGGSRGFGGDNGSRFGRSSGGRDEGRSSSRFGGRGGGDRSSRSFGRGSRGEDSPF